MGAEQPQSASQFAGTEEESAPADVFTPLPAFTAVPLQQPHMHSPSQTTTVAQRKQVSQPSHQPVRGYRIGGISNWPFTFLNKEHSSLSLLLCLLWWLCQGSFDEDGEAVGDMDASRALRQQPAGQPRTVKSHDS